MYPSPELAVALQRDREHQIAESRLSRIAACARACDDAPTGLIERLVRAARPAPEVC